MVEKTFNAEIYHTSLGFHMYQGTDILDTIFGLNNNFSIGFMYELSNKFEEEQFYDYIDYIRRVKLQTQD